MSDFETVSFGDYDVTTVVTAPPYYENCYVVTHRPTARRVVVDPGAGAAEAIARLPGKATVEAILLTHGHPDHVAGLAAMVAATKAPVHAHRAEKPVLDAAPEWGQALLGRPVEVPADIRFFDDEPTLDVLGGVKAVATPGHTPGGVCYVFDGFALTGDTLFMQGVGRTDFPGGNGPQLAASIGRFLDSLKSGTELFSGHGPSWPSDDAARWWRSMGPMMV